MPPAPQDGEPHQAVTILHFNDIYEVDPAPAPKNPCGGAARFSTIINQARNKNPLVIFGGDALSPSMISNFTKGSHMIELLNLFRVDVAVVGNHDFDFGVDNMQEKIESSDFPWLLGNVIDVETSESVASCPATHVLERYGHKIGIVGLVEPEWLETLGTINADEIIIQDFVERGNALAAELRSQGCSCVIGLTHMRFPNNERLALGCEGIDLVLSGHDHFYQCDQVNGKWVCVSGTNFEYITEFTLNFGSDGKLTNIDLTKKHEISRDVEPDPIVEDMIKRFSVDVDQKLDLELGEFESELDGKFMDVRTRETNLGNWICDICKAALNADCCVINSGTFRSDRVHPSGCFTGRDLNSILPFQDCMVVINVTGQQMVQVLENGVSQYPKLEGRFPQVSGIQFAFDARSPPGRRVNPRLVVINDEPLRFDKVYRLATKEYLAAGKDGYDVLAQCELAMDRDNAVPLDTMILNFFNSVSIMQGVKKQRTQHRQNILSRCTGDVSRRLSVNPISFDLSLQQRRQQLFKRRMSIQDVELTKAARMQRPIVEGRITTIENDEALELMLAHFRDAQVHEKVEALVEEDEES